MPILSSTMAREVTSILHLYAKAQLIKLSTAYRVNISLSTVIVARFMPLQL